jgi:c-di-GMP-related signal transduction protein
MSQHAIEELIEPVRYATRLPILSANQKVIGYKLLFRTSIQSYLAGNGPGDTNRTAIDVSSLLGLTTLCDNRLAFINCGREVLLENYLLLLPPEKLVVEIEKTVLPDDDVRQACGRLKQAGYKIALGGFTLDDPRAQLVAFADFLKVDIQGASGDDAENIVVRYRGRDCRMLAENVETREDFELAREAGFRYFQGYFFRRPEKVRARGLSSNLAICLQLMKAVSKPGMDWQEVEDIIKRDAALYYRLLRYLNSAALGLRGQVRSVRQALTILGEDHFRRWCRLALIFDMSQNQPSDLLLSALVRARFGELLGEKVEHGDSDIFLLGLLSLMDSILEIPMGAVLEDLPLDPESKTLLLEQTGRLAPLYALVLAIEAGSWWAVARACRQLGLQEQFVADSYRMAMEWAQAVATTA